MLSLNKYIVLLVGSSLLLGASCGNDSSKATQQTNIQSKEFQDKLIEANKMYVKRESDEIDQYVKHRGWNMITTGTGLRYMIVTQGKGELAKPEQLAKVNYKVSLLDGTVCYTSEKNGPKEFMVGKDNVESGLHEGIQYMHVGDKAILILPSHLAHGLLGDDNKIPAKSSVMYELELLSLR
ncbi:MAG: FKBP-type peptidyl-prolyl cis-trans isomerase [Bacteroidia bacterium]|nr:FKBP-type peptidyl-prolyl cis-trans isomerase [Bacteroidia bacterium]